MNTLICLLAVGCGEPPVAALHCPAPIAARGDVKAGPPLAHLFEMTHRGAGSLTITKVEASCGCLRRSLSSGVLSPGETAKLALEVNTLTQPDGPNRWQVTVAYKVEVPGQQARVGELLLQITAKLSREVSVSPPQIAFSTAGSASQAITILDSRPQPLTVLKVSSSNSHLNAEIGPREKGKGQTVLVKLAPDTPTGHRDEYITLLTDDQAYPELRVPVRVLKREAGGIVAVPESVSVRFAKGQTEVSTLVLLRAVEGKSVGVSSAESDLPGVTAKWSAGAAATAVVRVTVTELAAAQSGSCTVRVKLAEPVGQEVVIPVAWTGIKK